MKPSTADSTARPSACSSRPTWSYRPTNAPEPTQRAEPYASRARLTVFTRANRKDHPHRERDVTLDELGLLVRNPVDQLRLRHRPIVPLLCTVGPLCCGGDHSRSHELLTPAGPVGPDNAGWAARRSSDDLRALSAPLPPCSLHIGAGARGAPDGFVREDARAPARRDATETETNEAKTRSPEEMSLFIRSHFRTARGPGRGPVSASAVACGAPRRALEGRRRRCGPSPARPRTAR